MNNPTNREKRSTTISFRVSKSQRERIDRLAGQCGMNRSDYAKYTSMLNAMSQDERRAMFRSQPWMIETLRLLGRTAGLITKVITTHFSLNRIPGNDIETDKEQKST